MGEYRDIEKRLDAIASAVRSLDRAAGTRPAARRREPFDVDALTGGEVAELRALVAHEDDLHEYSASRVAGGGDRVVGMYEEFGRLGLVGIDQRGACVSLLPMAHWAVEKHDQRAEDAGRATKAQWRHDIAVATVSTAIGGALGIVGALLGVMLG